MKCRDGLNEEGKREALKVYCEKVGVEYDEKSFSDDDKEVIREIEVSLCVHGYYRYEICSSHTLSGRPEIIDLDNDSFWVMVDVEDMPIDFTL